MKLSVALLALFLWPGLSVAAKPPLAPPAARPQVACNLSVVTYNWDFNQGDQGFYPVYCDDGGEPVWEWGPTTYVAGAPGNVWGTVLDGDYPDESGRGLISPPFVVDANSSLVEVLHYYDIESSYDGCNVSAGIWPNSELLTPMGGYSVPEISSSTSYYAWCVDGEPGWTGSSGGWVLECFDLSSFMGQEISLEFDFGSDASVHFAGWYLARVTVGAAGPAEAACCDPATGDCQVVLEEVCLEMGGVWHPEWTYCDPNPCPPPLPWQPEIVAGAWQDAEPWHDWVGYSESEGLPLTLMLPPPLSEETILVEFYFFNTQTQNWEYLGQDDDGSQPFFSTVGDDPMVGDGFSVTATLPIPLPEPTIQLMARATLASGEQLQFTGECTIDTAPPSLVQTNIEDFMVIEDHTLDLVLYPNGAVIESVIVFVEAKADTFVKGIPGIDQHLLSDYHCVPTAAAQCFRYFEQAEGDNMITGGLNDHDLVAGLGNDMFTDGTGAGTSLFNWIAGASNWIRDHGAGYTLRHFVHFNASGAITWTQADWKRMRNELERCQDVLLGVHWDGGGGHAITLDAIRNNPLPNGRIAIGFKDPWTGQEETGELDPNTGRIENMTGAGGGGAGQITVTLIACPKEPMIDWGNGMYVFSGPVPDPPEATPINVPIFSGRYFVRVVVVNDQGHSYRNIGIVDYQPSSGAGSSPHEVPEQLALSVPRPNPFAVSTSISYALPRAGQVTLAIFDAAGRKVRTLAAGEMEPGVHVAVWNGRDDSGRPVASGTYYARVSAGAEERTQRIVLMK